MSKFLRVFLLLVCAIGLRAQTTVSLMPVPEYQFFSAAGAPLANGKVYTYSCGTNSPLATFTDSTGTMQNQNPIQLDAGGYAQIWISANCYKVVAKNAGGVTQWTVDGVSDIGALLKASLAGSTGASLVGFKQAGANAATSTVQAKLQQTVDAADFSGLTADVKINRAIISLSAVGGKVSTCGLAGPQTWAASPFTSITKPVTVVLCGNTIAVTQNVTVPSNVTLEFQGGAQLQPGNAITVTINGGIGNLGNAQIFGGAGTITISSQLIPAVVGSWFPGSDSGQKLNTAMLSLASGGVVDARNWTGTQTVSSNAFSSVTQPIRVLLGATTFNASAAQSISSSVLIEGQGDSTVWNVTGATNGFTFNAGSNYSVMRNVKVTGAATSVDGVASVGVTGGELAHVDVYNFKAGAGINLDSNSISWKIDNCYTQGNRYGIKGNGYNHHFIHPQMVNNADGSNNGTQFQSVGGQGIQLDSPLIEITNTNATVEGVDLQGVQSLTIIEPYVEDVNTGKAIKLSANGSNLCQGVRIKGGTWQTGTGGLFQISLEGDRGTIFEAPEAGLDESSWNNGATGYEPIIVLSTSTYDALLWGAELWKFRVTDSGSHNTTILDTPTEYIRKGGIYQTAAVTNWNYYSEALSNWTATANITVTDNSVTAPDGTATSASKVAKTSVAAGDEHIILSNLVSATSFYTFSIWLKADTPHRATLQIIEAGVGTIGARNVSVSTSWRRFYVTSSQSSAGGFIHTELQPMFLSEASSGYVYAWGAQLEEGDISPYIPTTGSNLTRSAGQAVSKTLSIGLTALTSGATANRAVSWTDAAGTARVTLSATDTTDLASVNSGACTAERDITIAAAAQGDYAYVAAATGLEAGTFLRATVTTGGGTCRWQLCNLSGGAVDRASDTYTCYVVK